MTKTLFLCMLFFVVGLAFIDSCDNKVPHIEPSIKDTIWVYPGDTIKYFGVDADGIIIISPKLSPHVFDRLKK